MEPVDLDPDGHCIEETSDKQSVSPSSPDRIDIFGDPQVNTRVGDDYQVEIPSLMTEFEHLQHLKNPDDSGVRVDDSQSFLIGLPIPILWAQEGNSIEDQPRGLSSNHEDAVNPPRPVESRNRKKIHIKLKKKGSAINLDPLDVGLDNGNNSIITNAGNLMAGETSLGELPKSKRCFPVPGSKCNPWSDPEVNGFLLGLYIFGKSFVSIKRFLENKEMGEILSFYYGKFYRSDHYRRWSDSRKVRSRKCITGRKIFTGWRLQEFLSRLLPHVPEEFQSTLLEGSKSFAEGRTSIEEYVSSLKSTVGIQILVETVGIGKGKDDLTGLAMEPGKTNHIFQVFPNLPTGKACSSLTPDDILKFLTGGFRLSKARCNDIFWEAVWPRLLARGWHSEQPKEQGYLSSKHYLVFLMPGVKKFSRRKLVKGDHYFDSVSDVLSKVASEPKLLEVEAEDVALRSCNEDGWVQEVSSDPDDPSDHQRHCYLKPRVTTCSSNHMKFTVVDTSIVHGGKSSNVREMKYLPVESKITGAVSNHLRDNGRQLVKKSLYEYKVYAADMPLNVEKKTNKLIHSKGAFDRSSPNGMKFTVVDTSLLREDKSSKVREIRCLPVESKSTSELTSLLRETEGASSEDSVNGHEMEAAHMLLKSGKNISATEDINQNTKDRDTTANKTLGCQQDEKTSMSNDRQLKMTIKHQFSRRVKSGHSDYVSPVSKRRKLIVCAKAKTSCIVEDFPEGLVSNEKGLCLGLNSPDAGKSMSPQVGTREKVSSNISSPKGSPDEESGGGILITNPSGMDMPCGKNEKRLPQPSLDLNLPEVPLKSKMVEALIMEAEDGWMKNADGSYSLSETMGLLPDTMKTSMEVGTEEQQPNMNLRRQGTRKRPPTIRALEAFANGFLSVQKRQKNTDVRTQENAFSSPSRKARSRIKVTSNRGSTSTKTMDMEGKEVNEACKVNKDMVSEPPIPIEKKWPTSC